MTKEQFVKALALTEGHSEPEPDWIFAQSHRFDLRPMVRETMSEFIVRLLERFYINYEATLTPIQIAMLFHKGTPVKEGTPEWDEEYGDRFAGHAVDVLNPKVETHGDPNPNLN